MNPPRFHHRVLGSLPVFAALLLIACGLVYDWWIHQDTASGWLPVIALFIGSVASNARTEVTRYRAWKRSWDAMQGHPSPPRRHGLKALLLLLLDLALGYLLVMHLTRTPPLIDFVEIGLCVATSVLLLYQFMQWRRSRPRSIRAAKLKAAHIAEVCLPVPKSKSAPQGNALPPYCQPLLQRRR